MSQTHNLTTQQSACHNVLVESTYPPTLQKSAKQTILSLLLLLCAIMYDDSYVPTYIPITCMTTAHKKWFC